MDNSFFSYLQQLESMAFFTGYPLLYAVILFIAGNKGAKDRIQSWLFFLLPFSYALVGTLYVCFQFKNLYPDYSIENIKLNIHQPLLLAWGFLAILFWVPAISKKPVLSFIHSLVFFFFLAKDLMFHFLGSSSNKYIVRNDMKIYTDSLLLNSAAFVVVVLTQFLFTYCRKRFRV
ncbi:MAG: hypothetical protein ABI688_04950 [Bacteroidota bacterium]